MGRVWGGAWGRVTMGGEGRVRDETDERESDDREGIQGARGEETRGEEGGGLEGLGRVLLCCERPCPPYHRLTLVISSNIAAKKLF